MLSSHLAMVHLWKTGCIFLPLYGRKSTSLCCSLVDVTRNSLTPRTPWTAVGAGVPTALNGSWWFSFGAGPHKVDWARCEGWLMAELVSFGDMCRERLGLPPSVSQDRTFSVILLYGFWARVLSTPDLLQDRKQSLVAPQSFSGRAKWPLHPHPPIPITSYFLFIRPIGKKNRYSRRVLSKLTKLKVPCDFWIARPPFKLSLLQIESSSYGSLHAWFHLKHLLKPE